MSNHFENLTTEKINERTKNMDICSTREILETINYEDMFVAPAVKQEIPNIEKVVDIAVEKIKQGGRLFYVGAGTSGRIGILDASECPPTYGSDPELVQGIIAGGYQAVLKAVEGAEDSEELGRKVIWEKNITNKDVVIGITASGRTPFVMGTIKEAKKIGVVTVGISNNAHSKIKEEVDIAITPLVGPEVIMGSTRMKSGTSQKMVLNMITTAVMVKLGKVYGNLMVDLQASNEKLVDRSIRIVMHATGVEKEEGKRYLELAEYNSKTAIVMIETNSSKEEAKRLLEEAEGFVTKAIECWNRTKKEKENLA